MWPFKKRPKPVARVPRVFIISPDIEDILILSGVLSITVPKEFLDSALYPVIVDPTFCMTFQNY
jgi:hypothetical protein